MKAGLKKLSLPLLLFCLSLNGFSQVGFEKVDKWMEDNVAKMGGRSILIIYQEGNRLFSRRERNEQTSEIGRQVFGQATRQRSQYR